MLVDFIRTTHNKIPLPKIHLNYGCPTCTSRADYDMAPEENADKDIQYLFALCEECESNNVISWAKLNLWCHYNGKAVKIDRVNIVYQCPDCGRVEELSLSKLFSRGACKINRLCEHCDEFYDFSFCMS